MRHQSRRERLARKAERESARLADWASRNGLPLAARLNDKRAVQAARGERGGIQCRVKNIRPIQVKPRPEKVVHYRDIPGVMKLRNRAILWYDQSDKAAEQGGRLELLKLQARLLYRIVLEKASARLAQKQSLSESDLALLTSLQNWLERNQ